MRMTEILKKFNEILREAAEQEKKEAEAERKRKYGMEMKQYIERRFRVCTTCWITMEGNPELTEDERKQIEGLRRVDYVTGCATQTTFYVPECTADFLKVIGESKDCRLPEMKCYPWQRLILWDKEEKNCVPIWTVNVDDFYKRTLEEKNKKDAEENG